MIKLFAWVSALTLLIAAGLPDGWEARLMARLTSGRLPHREWRVNEGFNERNRADPHGEIGIVVASILPPTSTSIAARPGFTTPIRSFTRTLAAHTTPDVMPHGSSRRAGRGAAVAQ